MAQGSFTLDLRNFVDKAQGRADLVIKKVALEVFSRTIMRTPVDTGRARANWTVAINKLPIGYVEKFDKSPGASVSVLKAAEGVEKAVVGDEIFMVNNVPYINRLESGYSKQAPAGMVNLTVREFIDLVYRTAAQ